MSQLFSNWQLEAPRPLFTFNDRKLKIFRLRFTFVGATRIR